MDEPDSPLELVRQSAEFIASKSVDVTIDESAIEAEAQRLTDAGVVLNELRPFDTETHFVDPADPELTVQYLFVVDALNFCFWPAHGEDVPKEERLEYHHLAGGLKRALLRDRDCLSAARLAAATPADLTALLSPPSSSHPSPIPLLHERARCLREVGLGLQRHFGGRAANMVAAAGGSAAELVRLVAAHFPAFRDHCVFEGRQVFFYKRAQIFVGDVWGALQGRGLGAFADIRRVTMFADYRVPAVLRQVGVLRYSDRLAARVAAGELVEPGGREEAEIRGCTIHAVELLRAAVARRAPPGAPPPISVAVDWHLWEVGEAARFEAPPHHRTLTVYY